MTDINAAAAIAMADDVPTLRSAPILTATLPGGYLDDQGTLHREVTVRELTGADEEALDVVLRGATTNPFLFTDTVISRAVVQIGDVTDIDTKVARRLLRGDRDALIVFIRRATYGDDFEGTITCPFCKQTSDITIDLAKDIPMKTLEDGNKRTFTVDLRGGRSAEVRLVTGDDVHLLGEQKNLMLSQANTLILSRCVLSIDGEPIYESVEGAEAVVKRLGSADRATIIDFMSDAQPGPQMQEVKVPCATCGEEILAPVDVASLLQ